ncbi:MAG: ribonuclease P protein component [Muribaculaceae bacterium]|nr:ribonuclease P protein component [Muribaculaceae bacterium]
MQGNRLYKREKLCGKKAIEELFSAADCGKGIAYPIRAVWRKADGHEGVAAQFLISVPKRRLRHAVDRVTVRRRIREAYRLNRALLSTPAPIDVAFIYLADSVVASDKIHRAMRRLLAEMSQKEVEQ